MAGHSLYRAVALMEVTGRRIQIHSLVFVHKDWAPSSSGLLGRVVQLGNKPGLGRAFRQIRFSMTEKV
jgi:hypothetical protein